jgi:phosphotransferase system enzyme I (PtsI)
LHACEQELRDEGQEIADRTRLGAMIEVPAAALALPMLAPHLDFASIGTNDLLQYLLAADRGNDAVASLYTPLHPAVLRLLHDLIATAQKRELPLLVCGELAGDPRYTRLLLALGLIDFSMHPGTLLEVRKVVRDSEHARLRAKLPSLLRAADQRAIERIVEKL